jgi:hypothetical protein
VLSEDGKLEEVSKERKSTFESGKRWKSCAGGAVRACNLLRVCLGSSEFIYFSRSLRDAPRAQSARPLEA